MKKCVAIAMFAGLVLSAPAIAGGPCCEKAKAENAWCSGCNHGFMFNVSIAKKALYETLAAIAASNECEGCKKAAETNGVCEKCHMGIVKDKAYKAMPAYYIARGEKAQADKISCASCASLCKTGVSGWCDKCNAGLVAGHVFTDKEKYDHASKGLILIQSAAKMPCEGCSVAIIMDGACEHCKVTYKDGKPSKS